MPAVRLDGIAPGEAAAARPRPARPSEEAVRPSTQVATAPRRFCTRADSVADTSSESDASAALVRPMPISSMPMRSLMSDGKNESKGEAAQLKRAEMKQTVAGEAESCHAAFSPVGIRRTHPVHGIGYAMLRIGPSVVALGGPRGDGWFVHLAEVDPDPQLLLESLQWLAEPRL